MNTNNTISNNIKEMIHNIRGKQVILDRDLAKLYNIETRTLKQAVNRNIKRFPEDFMFNLNQEEINILVSQSVIPSKKHLGGSSPYAFTEQGVANLSSILTSDKAININIQIMRTFVTMRKIISKNIEYFNKLDILERKQLEFQIRTEDNFEKVFDALEEHTPKQGIFFDGQIFDAYNFVSNLIRNAKKSIILIDNYINDEVLTLLDKRNKEVKAIIFTKNVSKKLLLDIKKYNEQYNNLKLKEFKDSHDRFLIIDEENIYHFGASLKDLGKKWFAFSRFDKETINILKRLDVR
ncbi:DNA-binding protein [Candidatus Woesearchaeota archaeon]|nr:MAG: DNA-binding protein [Candidatus Woesearchaeota archaeon]